ncbi:MAG: ATP-binding cassette domain-containing protein [Gemmatimonadaceae bacterium]|nr:ATP-binding cassette domain-containing protein [Gemmatimonadaceae bacterium]
MITVESLGVRAGRSSLLHDVSFDLAAGSWGMVLGPAGAGKTTLLESIAGVRGVESGTVRLRGRDVTRDAPETRRLGMVYQHGYLFPHLGVAENVRYGARDLTHAAGVAERLAVELLYERPVTSLSGGERQLVALARALASRPDILLLDEPFVALDPRRRAAVRRVLSAMRTEEGLTILQVTHDFGEATSGGDVALLLDGGRLVQTAAPVADLFRVPDTPRIADFLGVGTDEPVRPPAAQPTR